MAGPGRRRVDVSRWPTAARYAVALVSLGVVVGIVVVVRPDLGNAAPAGWYLLLVRIGAVVVLVVTPIWLVGWFLRRRRPR